MGPTALKPMLQDSEGYSARYFSLEMLSPAARAKLPAAGTDPLGFKRLEIKGSFKILGNAASNSPPRHYTVEETMINDHDNGVVRGIEHRSVDGLPLSVIYWSSYHHVAPLSWQSGLPSHAWTLPIASIRSVSTWDGMTTIQPNTTYDFVMNYAYPDPLSPSWKAERRCKSGSFYDASRFLAGLPGQAIDLACSNINSNGAKALQFELVWLTQYRVALLAKTTSVTGTTLYTYDSVVSEPAP